jgi:predicted phage terminase large subunit-like protein
LNEESQKRQAAQASLIAFTELTLRKYRPAAHHRQIAQHLEAVERGEIDRLMIFMPPRHGKSELASRRFPAWYLGRHPEREIISAGYGERFAEEFGREVRNIVSGHDFRRAFPGMVLAADSQAAGRWHTHAGGAYRAAGVGSGITGRGANLFVIDDPIKGHEEAESQVIRDKVWQWYLSDVYTRLEDPHAVVIIQTRWHWDDLAGRLLNEESSGGDHWTVLEIPAINAKGEALWPYDEDGRRRFPLERLERIRGVVGPRNWSSLYQQKPTPDEGGYFERKWFRYYDEPPAHLQRYGASDYAVTAEGGDWTVHIVCGVDPHDDIYLLDLWREQTSADIWIDTYLSLADKHQPHMWAAEKGVIEKSVGPFIAKRQEERGVYQALKGYASAADKPSRARSIQARMANGKVYFPRSAPWLAALESELLQFPAGVTDDQVDALGLIGRMLDGMAQGQVPKSAIKPSWPMKGVEDNRIRIDFGAIDKGLNIR